MRGSGWRRPTLVVLAAGAASRNAGGLFFIDECGHFNQPHTGETVVGGSFCAVASDHVTDFPMAVTVAVNGGPVS